MVRHHPPRAPSSSFTAPTARRWLLAYFGAVLAVWIGGLMVLAVYSRSDHVHRPPSSKPLSLVSLQTSPAPVTIDDLDGCRSALSHVQDGDRAPVAHTDTDNYANVYSYNVVPIQLRCYVSPQHSSLSSLASRSSFPVVDNSASLKQCQRDDYGLELLNRWKAAHRPICTSDGKSSINLHQIRQARHGGDDFYLSFNDATIIKDGDSRLKVNFRCEANNDMRSLPSLFAQQPGLLAFSHMMTFNQPVSEGGVDSGGGGGGGVVTVFAHRDCDGSGNLYHCSADLINAFMLLQAYQLQPANVRIIFIDGTESLTKFAKIWQALGAGGLYYYNGNTTANTDADANNARRLAPTIGAGYVSYQSGSNMIWKDFWLDDPCHAPSPMLTAYAAFTASLYLPPAIFAEADRLASFIYNNRPLTVLLASRSTAKYRKIRNEEAVLVAVSAALPNISMADEQSHSLLQLDMGTLSFDEQVRLINSVDIIIGMHGASLTLLLYLHPNITAKRNVKLLEVFSSASDQPRVYENLASRLGIKYRPYVHGGPEYGDRNIDADVGRIAAIVREWTH